MPASIHTFIRDTAVVTVAWLAVATLAADIHLSPHGDDAADGSAQRPVASLRRALDRVREIRKSNGGRDAPVEIAVADARYELAGPVVITPEDSGTERSPTVIRANSAGRPVFSGGRVITDWRVHAVAGQPRWTAELADVKAGTWNFCQLFVKDQRRFRPAPPASGWHVIAGTLGPSPASADKGHHRFIFSGDDLRADCANLSDVAVVAVHRWTMSRLRLGRPMALRQASAWRGGS